MYDTLCIPETGAGTTGAQPGGAALPDTCPFCAQREAGAERALPFKEQKESPPALKAGQPAAAGGALPAGVPENKTEDVSNRDGAALHTVGPSHVTLVAKTKDNAPFLLVNCWAQLPEQEKLAQTAACSDGGFQEDKEAKTAIWST